jgi:uncharacterized damage-inducible protein DinB
MSETTRIADQLHRAFNGEAWHGPALLELLKGVDAGTAAKRPPAGVHSIWEIVRHIRVWDDAAIRRMAGEVVQPTGDEDWPKVTDLSESAWKRTTLDLVQTHDQLIQAVKVFPDSRLAERVPGKKPDFYNFYYMLHGIVQHELYHAGQIAILKKLG